jgi:hypothetical protein
MEVVAEVVAEVDVELEGVRRRRPLPMLPPPPLPPPPVRRWNLETMVETRRRMDMDMEDWFELDEIVEGECFRLGDVSLAVTTSRDCAAAAASGNVRKNEGGTGIELFYFLLVLSCGGCKYWVKRKKKRKERKEGWTCQRTREGEGFKKRMDGLEKREVRDFFGPIRTIQD